MTTYTCRRCFIDFKIQRLEIHLNHHRHRESYSSWEVAAVKRVLSGALGLGYVIVTFGSLESSMKGCDNASWTCLLPARSSTNALTCTITSSSSYQPFLATNLSDVLTAIGYFEAFALRSNLPSESQAPRQPLDLPC